MAFLDVRLNAPRPLLRELTEFYRSRLGFGVAQPEQGGIAFEVGESRLGFLPASGSPFYHVAFLGPGDRFDAMFDWVCNHVELLPNTETGDVVFDFTNWHARAVYFHDPARNIVELIAHRGIGETGAIGAFTASELVGISEVGLVDDPPALAALLGRVLGLELWDGTATGEGRLAFVGEKARTLILCRAGRPWLPTGRPAEAHPVEIVLSGGTTGGVSLAAGGFVRSDGNPAAGQRTAR